MKIRTRLILAHTAESIITGVIAGLSVVGIQKFLDRWMLPLVELLAKTEILGIWIITILLATFIAVISPTRLRSIIDSIKYFPCHWGILVKVVIGILIWFFFNHSFGFIFWEVMGLVTLGLVVGYLFARVILWLKLQRIKNSSIECNRPDKNKWFADDVPAMTMEGNLLEEHRLLAGRLLERIHAKGVTEGKALPSMALIGAYGAGKTSICHLIEDLYNKQQAEGVQFPKILFCRFEGWQFLSGDAAVMGLLRKATERILQIVDAPELWSVPERYVNAITEGGGLWGKIIGLLCGENNDPEKVASNIGNTLIRLDRRLVIFVDDLDRMEVDAPICQQAITKALNQLQNVPNVQYVICVGPMPVRTEEKEDIRPSMDLLKLTRYQELVPEIDPEVAISKIKELRDEVLKDKEFYFPWAEIKQGDDDPLSFNAALAPFLSFIGISYKIAGIVKTPRVLKAVLRETQAAWEGGLKGEINWYDLVLANALKAAEPRVFEWVARNREIFEGKVRSGTDDQEKLKEYASRLKKVLEKCVGSGEGRRFEVVMSTLEELFPKFGADIKPAVLYGFFVHEPKEWEQCLSSSSASRAFFGISYMDRFFSGKVTEAEIPDQPTLQYIRKINVNGFEAREFEQLYVSSLEKQTGVLNKLVQFAGLISVENSYKICEALLEWISEPEHAKVWKEPDRYVHDMMLDAIKILRHARRDQVETKSDEWFKKMLERLIEKSPFTAIEFERLVQKEGFREGNDLGELLIQKLYTEFVEGERKFSSAFVEFKYSLDYFIRAIHRHPDNEKFKKHLTEKLIAEADGDNSHILKARIVMCLVEITQPARGGLIPIEECGFNVNKDKNKTNFDMEIIVPALQRWKDISMDDPFADKAMENLLKAYSQQ